MGGLFKNQDKIFKKCADLDVVFLAETFVEIESAPHLRVPSDSHVLHVHAERNFSIGRASGGFAAIVKNSVAKPGNCSFVHHSPGIAIGKIRLNTGAVLTFVVVYRAARDRSPVFDDAFHQNLLQVLDEYADDDMLLVGDFNTKIGDLDGPLGIVDSAEVLLPVSSESAEVDDNAADLIEILQCGGMFGLFDQRGGVVRNTFRCRGRSGGSVVDFIFANANLFPNTHTPQARFHKPSNHALLSVDIDVENFVRVNVDNGDTVRASRVRFFDLDKLSALSHSTRICELARSPEDFDVTSAYETMLEFVDSFTQVVTVKHKKNTPAYKGPDTGRIKREARRAERQLKVERNEQRRVRLYAEWLRLCEVWRECRKRDARVSIANARSKFFDAVRNKNLYLASRIARRNISGKGGGIRDSVTSCIPSWEWEDHFSQLFAGTGARLTAPTAGKRVRVLDEPFTGEEVAEILEKKKAHRAVGPDGFSLDHLRILRYDPVTSQALANLLNLCVEQAQVPDEWNHAFLFILYKGNGPKDNANNFRGITLKSQFLKLLKSLMCSRLRRWAECNRLLPDEQIAYRPGRNTTDHIYTLTLIREWLHVKGLKLHSAFVDLRKAFPSVDRQRLLNKLSELGVSDQFLCILTRLYSNDTFSILLDGKASDRVLCVNAGVHEGSPLSPLLFILFIAGLVRHLDSDTTLADGVKLDNGRWIRCILYADDVLLLAISPDGLQRLFDKTDEFFASLGLSVNPDKSDIIVFGPRGPVASGFTIAGASKSVRNEAKYLGVIFQRGGHWKCQQDSMVIRCRMARGRSEIICRSIGLQRVAQIVQIFDMFVSSVYQYSLGAWGPTAGDLMRIDDIFVDFIRRQFKLPPKTCRRGLLMHFGTRCASCDSMYLAVTQVARGLTTPGSVWSDVLATVWRNDRIPWVRAVKTHLDRMGIRDDVERFPANFLAQRKEMAVEFAKYCHSAHFLFVNGRSSDYFRVNRPFGILPAVFDHPTWQTRELLAFCLSCWRWAFGLKLYPEYCARCDSVNDSSHILFRCQNTRAPRDDFQRDTGRQFSLSAFYEKELSELVISAILEIVSIIRTH